MSRSPDIRVTLGRCDDMRGEVFVRLEGEGHETAAPEGTKRAEPSGQARVNIHRMTPWRSGRCQLLVACTYAGGPGDALHLSG